MREIKQQRQLTISALRQMCIDNNLYICGTIEEYDNILCKTHKMKNITNKQLYSIAMDIIIHSEPQEGEYHNHIYIMYLLNKCAITTYTFRG
jgi:Trm5-related predicted tRNA methylase